MKFNRKGFMMAEVIVVSAIVLIFLASLYVSYNQIYSKYKSRVAYYDSIALYRLSYYRDVLIENKELVDVLERAKTDKIVSIYNTDNESESIFHLDDDSSVKDRALIIYNNKQNLSGDELDSLEIHQTFKEYINYLSTSANFTASDYVMVMERCESEDECKYAYLELYDGAERPAPTASPSNPSSGPDDDEDESISYGGVCHVYNVTIPNACKGQAVTVWDCQGTLVENRRSCSYASSLWNYLATCNAICYYYCEGRQYHYSKNEIKQLIKCN